MEENERKRRGLAEGRRRRWRGKKKKWRVKRKNMARLITSITWAERKV